MIKLRKVTLNAARSKTFPEGSARHGYIFSAPLTGDGKIDATAWKAHRGECIVHRFWGAELEQHGLLAHRPGGHGGANWAFELGEALDEEEAGFRFADHAFRPGEYVSLREANGELTTFKVISVA